VTGPCSDVVAEAVDVDVEVEIVVEVFAGAGGGDGGGGAAWIAYWPRVNGFQTGTSFGSGH
jgi:hypothetical protein